MSDILVFLIALMISLRSFGYGLWLFSGKNISGGIFVLLLSSLVTALSSYLFLFNKA